MTTAQDLVTAFSAVTTDEALARFVQTFGLVETSGEQYPNPKTLAIYRGTVEGRDVALTHDWYDPSQAFSIRPDINKLLLTVAGMASHYHEY